TARAARPNRRDATNSCDIDVAGRSVMCNQRLHERDAVEHGSIEREIWVDAAPEVVFDVVSNPKHIADWWLAETDIDPVTGSDGELAWVDHDTGQGEVVRITVADAVPPRLFSFRWRHPEGEDPSTANSFLVRFELAPSQGGTLLR